MKSNLPLTYRILIFLFSGIIIIISAFWVLQVAIILAVLYVIGLVIYAIRWFIGKK